MPSVSTFSVGLTLCGAPVHDDRASKGCAAPHQKPQRQTEPTRAPQLTRNCGTGAGAIALVEPRNQTGREQRSAL